jgi:hypothetical protein
MQRPSCSTPGRVTVGRFEIGTRAWVPVVQRTNDPDARLIEARIVATSFYLVWEAR